MITVGLAVALRDQFTPNSLRVRRSMGAMQSDVDKLVKKNAAFVRDVSAGVAIAGATMIYGLGKAVKVAGDFEFIMAKVKAASQATQSEMQALMTKAKDSAETTTFSALEVGEAMAFMAKQGYKPGQINAMIQDVAYLAMAADMAIPPMAEFAGNLVSIFNLKPEQLTRVADVISYTANKTQASVDRLVESFRYSGDILSGLNFSIEESAAMLGLLAKAGIHSSIAGTSLANMWRELVKAISPGASKRKVNALAMMGLGREDFVDAEGNIKSASEVIGALKRGMQGLTSVQRIDALNDLFNIRGARGAAPLIRDAVLGEDFDSLLKALITQSKGYAQTMGKTYMDTFRGDTDRLKDSIINLGEAIGSAFIPVLRKMIQVLLPIIDSLQDFFKTPIGKATAVVVGGFIVMSTAAAGLLFVLSSIAISLKSITFLATVMGRTFSSTLAMDTLFGGMFAGGRRANIRQITTARGPRWLHTNPRGGTSFVGQNTINSYQRIFGAGRGRVNIFANIGRWLSQIAPFMPRLVQMLGRLGRFVIGPIASAAVMLVDGFLGLGNVVTGLKGIFMVAISAIANGIRFIFWALSNPGKAAADALSGNAFREFWKMQEASNKAIAESIGWDKTKFGGWITEIGNRRSGQVKGLEDDASWRMIKKDASGSSKVLLDSLKNEQARLEQLKKDSEAKAQEDLFNKLIQSSLPGASINFTLIQDGEAKFKKLIENSSDDLILNIS